MIMRNSVIRPEVESDRSQGSVNESQGWEVDLLGGHIRQVLGSSGGKDRSLAEREVVSTLR